MAAELEIVGYPDLIKKLDSLEAKAGRKVITRILSKSTNPLKRAWRAKAPVRRGDRLKKTYKGRYVKPGFLKRSIRSRVANRRLKRAVALVVAGVADEAFYGPQFLDDGITITSRKTRGSFKVSKPVKSYRIGARRWYFSTYTAILPSMLRTISKAVEIELGKI